MNNEIEQLLFDVAYKTALEMGMELLEMSCFISNWASDSVLPEEDLLAA